MNIQRPYDQGMGGMGGMGGGRAEGKDADEYGDGGRGEGKGGEEAYRPSGPHPLQGVPQYEDLPVPEPLAASGGGADNAGGPANDTELLNLVGEYLVRCIMSKQWSLREVSDVTSPSRDT